jgi:hypothetical protein
VQIQVIILEIIYQNGLQIGLILIRLTFRIILLPISGSREGIFYGSLLATKLKSDKSIFIMPDPFYPVYATAGQYTSKKSLL